MGTTIFTITFRPILCSSESIRQLIDDIDSMHYIFFIYAFDRSLIDNENAGLKSYQALWMRGYLLRTKIRAAIEFLDQLYQYGKVGKTAINELGQETFEEDVPVIEDN